MAINYTRKYAKDYNIWTRLYQLYVLYVLFWPFFNIFYRLKVEGRENLEKGVNYILAPNHISYFDPLLSAISTRKDLAFMAKIELFQNSPWLGNNIYKLGGFAVNRKKLDISTIKTVKEIAKTNWFLGIFPQGGIRKTKQIDKINKGFTVMAKMMQRDIIPMSIVGCEKYNWNLFKKQTVTIKIGKPISWELEDEQIIQQWRTKVAELTGYELIPDKSEKAEKQPV